MLSSFDSIYLTRNAESRSISAENPDGAKSGGARAEEGVSSDSARDLGLGWKVNPYAIIQPGETLEIAAIDGPGIVQSMWFASGTRSLILSIYWDGQETPSVLSPLSDFFALPWVAGQSKVSVGPPVLVNSLPISVNPYRGLNSFWPMPFAKHCRITIANLGDQDAGCYYQVNYSLEQLPDNIAYFHAHFRRVNPLPYKDVYTVLDGVTGTGQFVGCSMGWGINNGGWWGEGEFKFYIDGDDEFPTICGTGLEDYFGGSYNWDVDGEYTTYSTPFLGMHQVMKPDGTYNSQHRHSMYRYHVMDPIRFSSDLRVTVQALGWRRDGRYLPGMHDISSVASWYQTLPTVPLPPLPDRDELEII